MVSSSRRGSLGSLPRGHCTELVALLATLSEGCEGLQALLLVVLLQ